MASTYVNDLRLNEMATGDASGSWGTNTNTNLELIGEALGFGTETITTNADTHSSVIADGATDPIRAIFIKYAGTLDSACTITIGPNTVNKFCFIHNATSGSQSIIISQGSGANVTIATGQTKGVYLDGAGSGAAVVDAFATLSVVDLLVDDDLTVTDDVAIGGLATIGGTLGVTGVLTASDDVKLAHDGAVLGFGAGNDVTLTHVHDTGLLLNSSRQLQFGDSATHIAQSADGVLTITSDNAIVLDAGGDASIDIDGADLNIKDGGVAYLQITHSSPDLHLKNPISDGDILLIGNDGGANVTALKLDMSLAGEAVFNAGVIVNESGIDSNFRVESNGNASMFGINANADSGAGQVYVGADTGPAGVNANFHVGGLTNTRISIDGADSSGIFMTDSGGEGVTIRNAGGDMQVFGVAGHEFCFNQASLDVNFRVQSDGNDHAILVEGSGNVIVFGLSSATTASMHFNVNAGTASHLFLGNGTSATSSACLFVNRNTNDGDLVTFRQANNGEGTISVSGSTVAYNGFAGRHESSGIATGTAKGTVVSTIDELDVYPDTQPDSDGGVMASPKAGQTRADHAKVKVSDSVGDNRVYGVVDTFETTGKVNITSVGISPVKVTGACVGGDLLESNGDGTAKVQSDDIVRSKTIGKVTIGNSNTGVKLVSCVMYCG